MRDNLRELLQRYDNRKVTVGESGADVHYIPELSAYLKIAPHNTFSDLRNERNVLEWLSGKAPVPEILQYEETSDSDCLLTSAVAGVPLSELLSAPDSTAESQLDFARAAARGLRRLHDIPINDCPLDQTLDVKLERALKNIQYKRLSETDVEFAAEHRGKMPIDVYRELSESRPNEFDLVFTHGDMSMPNIIVNSGKLGGFVDLDGAGVADRYTDLAIFFRSFQRNCSVGVDLTDTFCEAYGIDRLDPVKMHFYARLDDLF